MPRGNAFSRRYNLVMHQELWDGVEEASAAEERLPSEWIRRALEEAVQKSRKSRKGRRKRSAA